MVTCAVAARSSEIGSVAIVGGTHGNEYTGVYVVHRLEALRNQLLSPFPFEVETLISNEAAHAANRRFIDVDLNRQFAGGRTCSVEGDRAAEIEKVLGTKDDPKFDLVVDLHTTTANMGTTIIADEWDPFATRAAAYLVQKDPSRKILYNAVGSRKDSPYLASVGRHAVQIECGPIPQGVLRHDVAEATESALLDLLEFCKLDKEESPLDLPDTVEAFTTHGSHEKLSWPVDDNGFPTAIVHKDLQDKDYLPLHPGSPVFQKHDGEVITYQGDGVVYPIFINEGGYYYAQSGRGIGLARKISLKVPSNSFAAASS